jgi:hypothetical protein
MAVVSFNEVVPRTISQKLGETATASRKFQVNTDGATNHQTIINTIGILFGTPHPEYSHLLCSEGSVTEVDKFTAEVTFSYVQPKLGVNKWNKVPTARQDVWSFSSGTSPIPAFTYMDAGVRKPLVNAAGEFFEGCMTSVGELKISITGNRATFNHSTATASTGRVNDAPYLGGAIGEWMCEGISGQQKYENNDQVDYFYYEVTANIVYRSGGHGLWLPNVGMNYKDGSTLKPCTVEYMGDKIPVTKPAALTATGEQASSGTMPTVRYYEVHQSADFSFLFGLPPT